MCNLLNCTLLTSQIKPTCKDTAVETVYANVTETFMYPFDNAERV